MSKSGAEGGMRYFLCRIPDPNHHLSVLILIRRKYLRTCVVYQIEVGRADLKLACWFGQMEYRDNLGMTSRRERILIGSRRVINY
jgi:hypothetical protein